MLNTTSAQTHDCSLGNLYDREVEAEFLKQQNHRETDNVSWYLRTGSVRIQSAHTTLEAQAGDWVFIHALTPRSHAFSADTQLISIRHRVHWSGLQFIPPPAPPMVYRGPLCQSLLDAGEALIALKTEHPDYAHTEQGSINSLGIARIYTWLHFWYRTQEASSPSKTRIKDSRVVTIMKEIAAQNSIRPLPYAQIAAKLSLSKAQIDRIFKTELGITPKQWQEAQCLRSAEDMLSSGKYTSKEIAANLDFFDASHFCKWFKLQSGHAPGQWKRQYLNGA